MSPFSLDVDLCVICLVWLFHFFGQSFPEEFFLHFFQWQFLFSHLRAARGVRNPLLSCFYIVRRWKPSRTSFLGIDTPVDTCYLISIFTETYCPPGCSEAAVQL